MYNAKYSTDELVSNSTAINDFEAFHDGALPDYTSSIRINQTKGFGVVVLSNINDQMQFYDPAIKAGTISKAIMEYLTQGKPLESETVSGSYERLLLLGAVVLFILIHGLISCRVLKK